MSAIHSHWTDKELVAEHRNGTCCAGDVCSIMRADSCLCAATADALERLCGPAEGYPGIAHDLEIMRATLTAIAEECADHPVFLGDTASDDEMQSEGGDAACITCWHHMARAALKNAAPQVPDAVRHGDDHSARRSSGGTLESSITPAAAASEAGKERDAWGAERIDNMILLLTADHNSGPNYVRGFELAREYMADRNEAEAFKRSHATSDDGK